MCTATGLPTGYAECGTVEIAWDGADLAALRDLQAFGTRLGLTSRLLTGRELRELEPALAAGLPGGLLAESDHQVDPRRLHHALITAAQALGARDEHCLAACQVDCLPRRADALDGKVDVIERLVRPSRRILDRDRRHVGLWSHHMLHGRDKLVGEMAMGDDHQADHGVLPVTAAGAAVRGMSR